MMVARLSLSGESLNAHMPNPSQLVLANLVDLLGRKGCGIIAFNKNGTFLRTHRVPVSLGSLQKNMNLMMLMNEGIPCAHVQLLPNA